MTDITEVVVGGLYWVIPTLDPDSDAEWERSLQPARFAGFVDGAPTWNVLGMEGASDWPMIHIGDRIIPPSSDHAFRQWGSEISAAIHPSVSVSMEWDSLDDLIEGLPPARVGGTEG